MPGGALAEHGRPAVGAQPRVPQPGAAALRHGPGAPGASVVGPPAMADGLPSHEDDAPAGGGGAPLPDELRQRFERSLGADLSAVRIHTDAAAAAAASRMRARAFAHGHDIYFAVGTYRPGSADGDELIAHEVAHTVQQHGAAPVHQARAQAGGGGALEADADRAAAAMVRGAPATVASHGGRAIQRWADDASARSFVTLIQQADRARLDRIILGIDDAARAQPQIGPPPLHVAVRVDGVFDGEVSPRDLEPLRRLALSRRASAPPADVHPAADAPPPAAGNAIRSPADAAALTSALARAGIAAPFAIAASVTADQLAQLVARLAGSPPSLATFGPRVALLRILRGRGETSLSELASSLARLPALAVMRPDGYMVTASDGAAIERFAGGHARTVDGRILFDQFEAGEIYVNDSNLYYRASPQLERAGGPIGEGGVQHDLANRALDGVEGALGSIERGIEQLLRDPIRALSGLTRLPGAAAALIRAAPELWERFRTMPLGDQVQLVSRVVTEVLLLYGSAEASTARISGAMGEAVQGAQLLQVMSVRLTASGALARTLVAVRPGVLATAIGGGPGAAFILHMANQELPGGGEAGKGPAGAQPGESHAPAEPEAGGGSPASPAARAPTGRALPPPPAGAAPPADLAGIMADAPAGARAIYPAELGHSSGGLTVLRAWMRLEDSGVLRVRISNFQGQINPLAMIGNLRTLGRQVGASSLEIFGDLFVAMEANGERTQIQRLVSLLEARGYRVERAGEATRLIISSL